MTDINSESIRYRLFKETFTIDGSPFGLQYSILIAIISKPSTNRPKYKNVLLFLKKSDGELLTEVEKETISKKINEGPLSIQSKTRTIHFSFKNTPPSNVNPVNIALKGIRNKRNHQEYDIPVFYTSLNMDSFISFCNAAFSLNTNSDFKVGWRNVTGILSKRVINSLPSEKKNILIPFLKEDIVIQSLKDLLRSKRYNTIDDENYFPENESKNLLNTKVLQFLFPFPEHLNHGPALASEPSPAPSGSNSVVGRENELVSATASNSTPTPPNVSKLILEKNKKDYRTISSIQYQYKRSKKELIENIGELKDKYIRIFNQLFIRYNSNRPEGFKEQNFEGDINDELTFYKNFIKIMVLKLNDPNLQYLLDSVLERDLSKDSFFVYFIPQIMNSSRKHGDGRFEFDLDVDKISNEDPHLDDHIYFFGYYFYEDKLIVHPQLIFTPLNSPNHTFDIILQPNEKNIQIEDGEERLNLFPLFNHFYKLILQDENFILLSSDLYLFLKRFMEDPRLHSNLRFFYFILQIFDSIHLDKNDVHKNTFFFLDVFSTTKINILELFITTSSRKITKKDIYNFIIYNMIGSNIINNSKIHSTILNYCTQLNTTNHGQNYIQQFMTKEPMLKNIGPYNNLMITPQLIQISNISTNNHPVYQNTFINLSDRQILDYQITALKYILITIQIFRHIENKNKFLNFHNVIDESNHLQPFLNQFMNQADRRVNHQIESKVHFLYQKIYHILSIQYNQLDISLFFFLYLDWFNKEKKLFERQNGNLFSPNTHNYTQVFTEDILNKVGPLLTENDRIKYLYNEKGNIHFEYNQLRPKIEKSLRNFKESKSRLNTGRITNEDIDKLSNSFKELIGVKNMYTIEDLRQYLTHLNIKIHKLDEESYKIRRTIKEGERTLFNGLKQKYLSSKEVNNPSLEELNLILTKMKNLLEKNKKSFFKNKMIQEYITQIEKLIELKKKYNQLKTDIQSMMNEEERIQFIQKSQLKNRETERLKENENLKRLQNLNLEEVNFFVFRMKKYKMMKKIKEMYQFLIQHWGFDSIQLNQEPTSRTTSSSRTSSTSSQERVQARLFSWFF